jgi:CAAX protease family protein
MRSRLNNFAMRRLIVLPCSDALREISRHILRAFSPMDLSKDSLAQNQEAKPSAAPLREPDPVFFGPHGLRAGWRLAIYTALYFVVRFLVLLAGGPILRGKISPLGGFFISECLLMAVAMLPAVFMCSLEDRNFGDYGLPRRGAFGNHFWAGAIWGFVAFTVLILVMRAMGAVSFTGIVLHGFSAVKFALFWAVMFTAVGLREEFLFRGYSLYTLADGIGFWPAALLLAAGFGGVHLNNKGEEWPGILGAAAIGLFFCLTLRRTGTLWFAVGMHMSWDWSETYLYSVPDSGLVLPRHLLQSSFHGPAWLTGGSVGPEGSVLLFVLIGLMWLLFDRAYPAKKSDLVKDESAAAPTT